jgi:hypothetical protein
MPLSKSKAWNNEVTRIMKENPGMTRPEAGVLASTRRKQAAALAVLQQQQPRRPQQQLQPMFTGTDFMPSPSPMPQVPMIIKPKAARKPRTVKPKCKEYTVEDICNSEGPRCRWIQAKGKLSARCGNKARPYVPKAPKDKIPRCSTFEEQVECPLERCRWLPEDTKRKRPERCANKAPKARTYGEITIAEARAAFDDFYTTNQRKNGTQRYKVPGCAKETDLHYKQTAERIIKDKRYLTNPSRWDFQGVDTGDVQKPVRTRRK